MTRDPNRIDPILARLRAAWVASPDLRLGQLLACSLAIGGAEDKFARLFNAECPEFGAVNAPIEWPPVDRPAPTPTPAPGLDLDAVEEATISDDQLSAWLEVAGAASPAALQYGPSRGDGREFILDAYNKGPAGSVHTVWYGDPDDALIVAVTGNGPTSEANAKHIAWSSPRNVAALLDEVRALRAEARALRAAAEEREADMHARIRAGYDKTVADAWRAEVAKRDAEIADLRALVESQRRDYLDVCDAIAPETSGPADAAAKVRALRAKLADAKRLGLEACEFIHGAIANAPDPMSRDLDDRAAIAAGHNIADRIAAALEVL